MLPELVGCMEALSSVRKLNGPNGKNTGTGTETILERNWNEKKKRNRNFWCGMLLSWMPCTSRELPLVGCSYLVIIMDVAILPLCSACQLFNSVNIGMIFLPAKKNIGMIFS
jgi:hypothetical protein